MTYACAEVERVWRVRGRYPNGGRLEFTVYAFDHAGAVAKAETKRGRGVILDVVLWSTRADETRLRARAVAAWEALHA